MLTSNFQKKMDMAVGWKQLEEVDLFSSSSSCSNSLLSLPEELIGHVVSFLSLQELANTRLVSWSVNLSGLSPLAT